jgi:ribosomal protein S12 methylthiotransferase accessory factor
LDQLALSDELTITEAIGVIFEEGTAWSSLRIGELKALLALATENFEEGSHWCSWCNNFGHLPPDRQTLYRAIHTLLEFERTGEKQSDYYTSLNLFFDEQVVRDAIDIVAGRKTFNGLTFGKSWEEVSPAHQAFINIYKRLHPLKAAK